MAMNPCDFMNFRLSQGKDPGDNIRKACAAEKVREKKLQAALNKAGLSNVSAKALNRAGGGKSVNKQATPGQKPKPQAAQGGTGRGVNTKSHNKQATPSQRPKPQTATKSPSRPTQPRTELRKAQPAPPRKQPKSQTPKANEVPRRPRVDTSFIDDHIRKQKELEDRFRVRRAIKSVSLEGRPESFELESTTVEKMRHRVMKAQSVREQLKGFGFAQASRQHRLQRPTASLLFNANLGKCLNRLASGTGEFIDD